MISRLGCCVPGPLLKRSFCINLRQIRPLEPSRQRGRVGSSTNKIGKKLLIKLFTPLRSPDPISIKVKRWVDPDHRNTGLDTSRFGLEYTIPYGTRSEHFKIIISAKLLTGPSCVLQFYAKLTDSWDYNY